jgi:hypothetical protein
VSVRLKGLRDVGQTSLFKSGEECEECFCGELPQIDRPCSACMKFSS